jgi:hypothetical protein
MDKIAPAYEFADGPSRERPLALRGSVISRPALGSEGPSRRSLVGGFPFAPGPQCTFCAGVQGGGGAPIRAFVLSGSGGKRGKTWQSVTRFGCSLRRGPPSVGWRRRRLLVRRPLAGRPSGRRSPATRPGPVVEEPPSRGGARGARVWLVRSGFRIAHLLSRPLTVRPRAAFFVTATRLGLPPLGRRRPEAWNGHARSPRSAARPKSPLRVGRGTRGPAWPPAPRRAFSVR